MHSDLASGRKLRRISADYLPFLIVNCLTINVDIWHLGFHVTDVQSAPHKPALFRDLF